MKLAIMQPYFFPYVGYFNLIAAADKFVFYDDVNFIKNGWINRNRLFINGEVRYITVPLSGASANAKINKINIQPKKLWERKLLASIEQSYSKAPNFAATFDLVRDVLNTCDISMAELAKRSVIKTAERLSLPVQFVHSSASYHNEHLQGAERVLAICAQERAQVYINLPGGAALYSAAQFAEKGIDLAFISACTAPYAQFKREFSAGLSMLDILMFNPFEQAQCWAKGNPHE